MLDLLYCTPTVLTFSILLPLCPPPRCALVQATCARTPIAPSALSFRAGAIAPVNAPFSTAARSGPVLPPSARVRCSLEGGRWVAWHHPCSCTHSHTASHTASLTHFHLPSLSICPLLLLPVAEPPSPTHALTHALTHTHSHTRTHTHALTHTHSHPDNGVSHNPESVPRPAAVAQLRLVRGALRSPRQRHVVLLRIRGLHACEGMW